MEQRIVGNDRCFSGYNQMLKPGFLKGKLEFSTPYDGRADNLLVGFTAWII
jgi:hypothetical protein